ncbi:MAG: [FeFe] hydrogenase H-cluster radical SAM maturase HydG [Halochromatium sp.]
MRTGDATGEWIDEHAVNRTLAAARERADAKAVRDVLAKAEATAGLDASEVAVLMGISDPELLGELFAAARRVKEFIYGRRLVVFAPLYVSNLCANECLYCAFRAKNSAVQRRALSQTEIAREVEALVDQGHKRVLLVAGEAYPRQGFDYILESIDTVYSVHKDHGEIRRVNVNVAPLTIEEFRQLKAKGIGTYQIFQETYHRETYAQVHLDRAMEAGIDDVGIGVLFGLHDWRFEVLAMMQHIAHLEQRYGVGPHTISVPRLEPATGSSIAEQPPHAVDDTDFRKLVAILRLAVPYTGLIMSTRETPHIRRETFALGVSQISAGSRTDPGGYSEGEAMGEQFSLGDHRNLDEVIGDVAELGYLPSFCTGCYRLGRTGADFMDLAKPGAIKAHCDPNAVSTFQEYLLDYATPQTRSRGEELIERAVAEMEPQVASHTRAMLAKVRSGRRDVYC